MRLCARRSRHSFSRRDFRIQRMLSQEMLRSSKPWFPRQAKLVSPFCAIWSLLTSFQ
jgi:hypothetical protein